MAVLAAKSGSACDVFPVLLDTRIILNKKKENVSLTRVSLEILSKVYAYILATRGCLS